MQSSQLPRISPEAENQSGLVTTGNSLHITKGRSPYGKRHNPDGSWKTCGVEGCSQNVESRGLCKSHYVDMYKHGQAASKDRLCSIDGCGKNRSSLEYCPSHLYHFQRYGDPLHVRTLRLFDVPKGINSPTDLGKVLGVSRQRAHQLLQPHKQQARRFVSAAIEQGIIAPPPFCLRCGEETTDLEAHHWSYDRPLDVGWFCTKCHSIVHPHAGGAKKRNDLIAVSQ